MAHHGASPSSSKRHLEPSTLEGWLLRESTYVPRAVNKRYAMLLPTELVTLRRQGDFGTAKTWQLDHRTVVDPPGQKAFSLVTSGRTKTLWAIISNEAKEVQLKFITVHTAHGSATLAFEDSGEAQQWFAALRDVIAALKDQRVQRSDGSASSAAHSGGGGNIATLTTRRATASTPRAGQQLPTSNSFLRHVPPEADAAEEPPCLAHPSMASEESDQRVRARKKWRPYTYVNGVSVYLETPAETGPDNPAILTSHVIHAPPLLCAQGMITGKQGMGDDEGIGTDAISVLEKLDEHTAVLREAWPPAKWLRLLIANRELVLRRSWRKEDDGTFVILYSSTTHHKARPQAAAWWQWLAPVRATVEAGYTFSPLMPRYTANGTSHECLVTQVVKVDLGGWLGNPGKRARSFLWPLVFATSGSFLSRIVRGAVVLREQVEQERFVVRPSMLGGGDAEEDPGHLTRMASRSATFRIQRASGGLPQSRRSVFTSLRQADTAAEGEPLPPTTESAVRADGDTRQQQQQTAKPLEPYSVTGTLDQRFWTCPGSAGFKVRGPRYIQDHKKVAAGDPVFQLASVDLVETDEPCFHIARFLPAIRHSRAPFTFVVNIMVPQSPPLNLCAAWSADVSPGATLKAPTAAATAPGASPAPSANGDADSDSEERGSPFDIALARFVAGGDDAETNERRNATFKLLPKIVHGSWVVKQSVGETPVLLGRKLTTRYFRGDNYMEVDIDVASSSVARHVVGLVAGATKSVVVDMGILLQGNQPDELPEELLGTLRLLQIDLSTATYLDVNTGKLHPKGAS